MIQPSKGYIKNPIYISYTGLTDFLKCPRAYFLKNLYKDQKQNFKLQIISPYLTLGSTVHDALKWYLESSYKPSKEATLNQFRNFWRKYRSKRGGFSSLEEEISFGTRGLKMINNFLDHTDCLEPCAPFLSFPKFNLVDNIILIGNFDFVGQCNDGSLHIVDFKTGAHDEDSAIQLYIYAILAESNFSKRVSKASFWYLDREDGPREIVLDPLNGQLEWLKQKALELKKAIEIGEWICSKGFDGNGEKIHEKMCRDCFDYQALLDGKGEWLFSDFRYKKEIFYLAQGDFS
jgi:ATP-dependent helicase/DNAse subunit B